MDKTNIDKINHNPDILNCLANLSNDEVFTPPKVANDMLDMLPTEIWSNKTTTFLDPCTKTGVFLREIVKRLMIGLEQDFPVVQERINHILQNQVFGMGITHLTALISRRTVYCSKKADVDLSITDIFDTEQGNIRFNRIEHTWKQEKCTYCGAKKDLYDRGEDLETHAYEFLHTDTPQDLFKDTKGNAMKFDVIIGNPPYQMSDGGAQASARPLYHLFVQQAKKLNPRYLSMIVPARWYAGGKGLDDFRDEMLNDASLKTLIDYPNASDCFNGVEIKSGVCYFLWDRDTKHNACEIITMDSGGIKSTMKRPLLSDGMDTFIRFNEAISIYDKVKALNENSFADIVSSRKPFGLATDYRGRQKSDHNSIKIYTTKSIGYINNADIVRNHHLVNTYKIYISKAYNAGDNFPHQILGEPILGNNNDCCSETYIIIGAFDTEKTAKNAQSYMTTKFLRFMVMLKKVSQDAPKRVYQCVPMQDFSQEWTDEKLYKKYNLNEEEIIFIESMIKPMKIQGELL